MNNCNVIASAEFSTMVDSNLQHIKFLSPSYVESISVMISYFIILLEKFPYIFPTFVLPTYPTPLRKVAIAKRYLLLYQITNNTIELLYFVDGRCSPENYLLY